MNTANRKVSKKVMSTKLMLGSIVDQIIDLTIVLTDESSSKDDMQGKISDITSELLTLQSEIIDAIIRD